MGSKGRRIPKDSRNELGRQHVAGRVLWQAFRDEYANAKLVDSTTGLGVKKERQLSKPL
jgi:hypothetical protein